MQKLKTLFTDHKLPLFVGVLALIVFCSFILLKEKTPIPIPKEGVKTFNPDESRSTPPVLTFEESEEGFPGKEWLKHMPIKHPNYYIEYDFASGSIKSILYTYDSFSVPKEDQITHMKEEVQGRLQIIGVNLNKEIIEWEIR